MFINQVQDRFIYEVVICTYNGECFLLKQIDSILKQSILPKRIIVCDDSSNDSTLQIINNVKKISKIPIVIYQRNNKRYGVAGNFFYALTKTKEQFVFLCDQDDVWKFNKAEVFFNYLNNLNNKDIPLLLFSDAEVVDVNLNIIYNSFVKSQKLLPSCQLVFHRLLFQNCVQGASTMINDELIKLIRLSDHIIMHDWWLALIAQKFGKVYFINEQLIKYRQHSSNTIGCSHYGFKTFIGKILDLKSIRELNQRIIKQALAFNKCYGKLLTYDELEFFKALILSRDKKLKWYRFLKKYAISRTTLLRTLSLYLL